MKLIITYDNTDLKNLDRITATNEKAVTEIHVLTVEGVRKKNLYDVAVEIKKETAEDAPSIILIDQYLECADEGFEWLQRNAGIALVKFLRMLEVNHHIVLISPFEPYELIKISPANLIVSSKGISFTKYLYEFSEKSLSDIETLASDKFDGKQNLKPYIMAEFSLPEDERHNWANWWGIVQLIDAHRSLYSQDSIAFIDKENKQIDYPVRANVNIKRLLSQQAIYLFGHSSADFIKATNTLIIADIEKQIRIILNYIDYYSKRLTSTGRKNPKPDYWVDMKEHYHNLAKENLSTGNAAAFYNEEKKMDTLIKQKEVEFDQLKTKKKILEASLDEIVNSDKTRSIDLSGSNNIISDINKLREAFRLSPPKILYIDDQANEGWGETFQLLLYGQMSRPPFDFIHDCGGGIEDIYIEILLRIKRFNPFPDLVLLDLRLKKEYGNPVQLNDLSGAEILRKIRGEFPGLPIMMTTASNKAWTFEEIMKIGADAYWIKEGIDNINNPEDTIQNYYKFLWLINKLQDKRYQVLKDFSQFVKELDYTSGWWIEFQREFNVKSSRITANAEELRNLLNEVVENIRMYLHHIHLEYGIANKQTSASDSYYSSSIINKLGNIVEIIHDIQEHDYERVDGAAIDISAMIRNRGDFNGGKIREIRHKASHREYYKSNWEKLEVMIEKIKKYLTESPKHISVLK